MLYVYLKAIHVIAVVTLLGGMLLLAFTLSLIAGRHGALGPREAQFVQRVRRWDRLVTNPALGLVWIVGISLMVMGDWYSSVWLMIKIVPVLMLSALHGMESAALRRLANGNGQELSPLLRHALAIIAICFVLIALLAVVKPF